MVKHNNVLPNVHFHKYWQRYVKTWFNQPGRKKSRRIARQKKAAAIAPRPVAGLLRPAVHPPTQRYNLKIRKGRGFTVEELKSAKLSPKQARQLGVAVDFRRRNRCEESLKLNAERLQLYLSKMVVLSGKKATKGSATKGDVDATPQNTHRDIIPLPRVQQRQKARAITAEERGSK